MVILRQPVYQTVGRIQPAPGSVIAKVISVALGKDTGLVRQHNRAIVLELLRTQGPLSRPAVARRGGLSRPTVIEITGDLIQEGLLREVGYGPSTGGRRPVLLELASEAQWSIGVRIGLREITGVITDLHATVHQRRETPYHMREGPHIFLARVEEVLTDLIRTAPDGWRSVRGIGVALPAPVLMIGPLTVWSAHYPVWDGFRIKEALAAAYSVPVLVDNNANTAALGEHFFGAGQGAQQMLYVLISQGIGGGVIVNGEIYRGAAGGAGEIGHATIDFDGPRCSCGRHGCLGVYASAAAIVRRARQALVLAGRPALGGGDDDDLVIDDVIDAALAGDELAIGVLEEAGRYLGIGLANAIHCYDPGLIVLGGPAARAGQLLLAPAVASARQQLLPGMGERARIMLGQLGEDAEAIGAAVLPLRDLFRVVVPEEVDLAGPRQSRSTQEVNTADTASVASAAGD